MGYNPFWTTKIVIEEGAFRSFRKNFDLVPDKLPNTI